ncbi:MAG: ABC transporter substrate-binding protein [Cytophagales bacterium]|nr:ABC transporter substrate-binding protein [Cytophagales bacterium]MDW8385195.1 ABC transporter substrate-binding protein [Flammeovirgaceae bacterium]
MLKVQMKRLGTHILIWSTILICILSCDSSKESTSDNQGLIEAKGGRYYGGVFRLNESEYIKNLFPLSIIDAYSYRVASQIYEGLFKFTQDSLKVVPALVESYTVDDATRTVYTFKLKKGVYFHDDDCFPGGKGREMTANDVKYCFTLVCTQDRNNQSFNLFDGIVKGANEYFTASATNNPLKEVEGIKVIDDYTIRITLVKPNSMFISNLARPGAFIFPKEAYEKYGADMRIKCVGTGPFMLSSVDEDISIILKKNPKYHGYDKFGNKLPFLDGIRITFMKDKKVELMEFRKGNLDMMYRLPTDHIIEILHETETSPSGGYLQYELQREPEMSTQLLTFNTTDPIFKDVNIRKAISYAIDKEKILDYVLNGEGYGTGKYGVTPPSFKNYDITNIRGYDFNLDSAKFYLKKAGYPNGQGLKRITLDLNAEGERYTNVAVELQKQLKDHLNIELDLNISPLSQIAEKSTSGNFSILRHAWIADYPHPENFLWAFYGKTVPTDPSQKSYPNLSRYKNDKFDKLYEAALNATSEEEALAKFMEAEKLLMLDAPVVVLWYDEGYRLLQSQVKNFPSNPMQYRDFSEVYFTPRKENKPEN